MRSNKINDNDENTLEKLPDELQIELFKFLDRYSFFSLASVNKKFFRHSKHPVLSLYKLKFLAPLHNKLLTRLNDLLNECWNISETAYYDTGLTKEMRKTLRLKYLEFQSYKDELKNKNIPGVNEFSEKNAYYISEIAKEVEDNNDHQIYKEQYQAEKNDKTPCLIS